MGDVTGVSGIDQCRAKSLRQANLAINATEQKRAKIG